MDKIVKNVRNQTGLGQCTRPQEAIDWFKVIKNKQRLNFIVFDIDSFYPSITPELLNRALGWAKHYATITQQQVEIIFQACESFLYSEGTNWVKKGDVNFDIGMGAYHGAQACEIVGLFLLAQLKVLPNFEAILYRDDGLAVSPARPRQTEIMKKKICQIFNKNGLKVTIEANLKSVNFLDITMDLRTGTYKPFMKENDTPQYVHRRSNHPPSVLNNIPAGVNRRLSRISS